MKKLISLLLVLLTLIAPLSSLADARYYSIADLREHTPDRWTESYKTKWRTIEVDAEVRLPKTDAAPVLKVTYDVPKSVPTAEGSGWAEIETRYKVLRLYNSPKQAPKSVNGKRVNKNVEAKETWRSGFAPENTYVPMSDITYGEICDMLRDNLMRFGYDPTQYELDTPTLITAHHWYQYGYKQDVLPGRLSMIARQTINGLPLLQHIQNAVFSHKGESRSNELVTWFEMRAEYDAYGEMLSALDVFAAKPVETLAEDVPLCSFDKILAAIEPEITAGHIRKIYEVELGYTIYNEPGVYFASDESEDERLAKYAAAHYYLRPMWQINCLWVETPTGKLRETASNTTDERNSLDYYQLLVDAQTGELIQENKARDRCEFKGFISWDEVDDAQ